MTGYSTGDNNRLLDDGTHDYEYDDEGNGTKKTNPATGDYEEYGWDHRNRLVSVTFRDQFDATTKEVPGEKRGRSSPSRRVPLAGSWDLRLGIRQSFRGLGVNRLGARLGVRGSR